MNNNNVNISYDAQGNIITDDEKINQIIRAVETEQGGRLMAAIPLVSYEDNPDDKKYLILLKVYSCDEYEEDIQIWEVKTGRQYVYDYLKDMVKNEVINPNESFIIAADDEFDDNTQKENIKLNSKPITVFRFLKVMFDGHKVIDDVEDFDINEFDPFNYDKGDKTILEV